MRMSRELLRRSKSKNSRNYVNVLDEIVEESNLENVKVAVYSKQLVEFWNMFIY